MTAQKWEAPAAPVEYPLRPDGTGWRVKTTETHHVDVVPMLYNTRIVMTPIGDERIYDRYWCYATRLGAVAAAHIWDGSPDTEPTGWTKAHGERYPE